MFPQQHFTPRIMNDGGVDRAFRDSVILIFRHFHEGSIAELVAADYLTAEDSSGSRSKFGRV